MRTTGAAHFSWPGSIAPSAIILLISSFSRFIPFRPAQSTFGRLCLVAAGNNLRQSLAKFNEAILTSHIDSRYDSALLNSFLNSGWNMENLFLWLHSWCALLFIYLCGGPVLPHLQFLARTRLMNRNSYNFLSHRSGWSIRLHNNRLEFCAM